MNRRWFLRSLSLGVAGLATQPLWKWAQPPSMTDEVTGIAIRMVRQYDIQTDRFPSRIDCLYGFAIMPGHENRAVRVYADDDDLPLLTL